MLEYVPKYLLDGNVHDLMETYKGQYLAADEAMGK